MTSIHKKLAVLADLIAESAKDRSLVVVASIAEDLGYVDLSDSIKTSATGAVWHGLAKTARAEEHDLVLFDARSAESDDAARVRSRSSQRTEMEVAAGRLSARRS